MSDTPRYCGWYGDGNLMVAFFSVEIIDLQVWWAEQAEGTVVPLDWGNRSKGAQALARLMLWHATQDASVIYDLAEMFFDHEVSRWEPEWQRSREWVCRWVQDHHAYREMMHGRKILPKCPGCG